MTGITVDEFQLEVGDEAGSSIGVYRALPEGTPRGAIIVIHEIWGIQEQTRSIARHFADDGFIAIAPDVLSHIGVDEVAGAELQYLRFDASEEERHREQQRMRDLFSSAYAPDYIAWAVAALSRVVDETLTMDGVDGRVAVTGFCFGGGLAWQLAAADTRVRAAIPFYGRGPDLETLGRIQVPVLAIFGELDEPLIGDLPRLTADAQSAGVAMETVVYPDAPHAFFNDLNPTIFRAEASADAYRRALEVLDRAFGAA